MCDGGECGLGLPFFGFLGARVGCGTERKFLKVFLGCSVSRFSREFFPSGFAVNREAVAQ
jgi:hypothetical protein